MSNANVTLSMIRSGQAYFGVDNATYSAEIKAVQKALFRYGFYPGTPDGYYGNKTAAAVRGLQNEKGLTVNGLLNQGTLQSLESWAGTIYGNPTATPSLDKVRKGLDYFHVGDSGYAITTIRGLLNAKGYSCATTGSYDSALQSVVTSFQNAVGLTADGLTGQGTLAALEDTVSDSNWLISGNVNLTAGKLARAGFTDILLRPDIISSLNAALNAYGINTKMKVRQFLAQCMAETDKGRSLVEYSYQPCTTGTASYAPYYGGGLLHLSWSTNYAQYKNYKGDSKILNPAEYATQHVAFAYPADSAGWYWDVFKNMNSNSVVNWSDTAWSICNTITTLVYGDSSQTNTRYNYYLDIASILL